MPTERPAPTPHDSYLVPGWRCEPSEARPQLVEVVRAAVGDLGIEEDPPGSNAGPRLDKYHAGGQPWCVYALSYWFRHSEIGCPWGRLGSAWKLRRWARENHRFAVGPPVPGDVFTLRRGLSTYQGHAGLIVAVLPDGRVCTVEGNVRNAVRGLIREVATFTGMIRPVPLPPVA